MIHGITIGKLSASTRVNIETIRYYEKIGVMRKPERSDGGHRIYTLSDRNRLNFIRRGRELGFPLDDVRSLLGLNDKKPTCAEVLEITTRHLDDVRQRLSDLMKLEKQLARSAKECAKNRNSECPIIDVLSSD